MFSTSPRDDVVRGRSDCAPGPVRGLAMVVEPDMQLRDLIGLYLQDLGFRVVQAGGGREGLERFREFRRDIRLIVQDVLAPRLDDWALMDAVRRSHPRPAIVTVGGSYVWPECHLGTFLAKPFRRNEFETTVRSALAGS